MVSTKLLNKSDFIISRYGYSFRCGICKILYDNTQEHYNKEYGCNPARICKDCYNKLPD